MDIDRFEPLLDRYQSGEANPEEITELESMLRAEPEKRRRFVERCLLEVQLHKAFSSIVPMAPTASPAPHRLRRLGIWTAAAAIVLVVGIVVLSRFGRKDVPGPEVVSGKVSIDGVAVDRIPAGTWFEVADKAPLVLRLSDDSRAKLDRSSRASIQGSSGEARQVVELARGGGTFTVTHGGGQFQVKTPLGTVTALGTEFSVKLRSRPNNQGEDDGKPVLAVTVHEGTVQVDANGKSYVLKAGKSRFYDDDGEHNNRDDGQQNNQKDNEESENGDELPVSN